MASESGFSNQLKKGSSQFKTIQSLGGNKFGQSVASKALYEKVPSAEIINASEILGDSGQPEFLNIQIIGHQAIVGDILRIDDGDLQNYEFDVIEIFDANNLRVLNIADFSLLPGAFASVMNWVTNKANPDGSQIVSVTIPGVALETKQDDQIIQETAINTALGLQADTAATTDTGSFSIISFIKRSMQNWTLLLAKLPALVSGRIPVDASGVILDSRISNGTITAEVKPIGTPIIDADNGLVTNTVIHGKTTAGGGAYVEVKVTPSGAVSVDVGSSALPTGAATSANQVLEIAELQKVINTVDTVLTKNDVVNIGGLLLDYATVDAETNPQGVSGDVGRQVFGEFGHSFVWDNYTHAQIATTNGLLGPSSSTPPANDTDTSALNGRLIRIAQRITSLIALLPTSLGQKTMANSLAVTIASDQSSIPTVNQPLTGTFQEILNLTTSAQTFTAPANAKWCKIYADDTNAEKIRVKIGGTATISSGIQMQPGRAEDFSIAGNISVIAESGTNQKINVHFGV